jgi:hypothetical protein
VTKDDEQRRNAAKRVQEVEPVMLDGCGGLHICNNNKFRSFSGNLSSEGLACSFERYLAKDIWRKT